MNQEERRKWKTISPVEYEGKLMPCPKCGKNDVRVFCMDVGDAWYVHQGEKHFAVRCSCGQTGVLYSTGINIMKNCVDEQDAVRFAADAWNREQEGKENPIITKMREAWDNAPKNLIRPISDEEISVIEDAALDLEEVASLLVMAFSYSEDMPSPKTSANAAAAIEKMLERIAGNLNQVAGQLWKKEPVEGCRPLD